VEAVDKLQAEVAFDEVNGEVYSGHVHCHGIAFQPENGYVALGLDPVSVRLRFQEFNRLHENTAMINDTNLFCDELDIQKREWYVKENRP
jgi:hypothetical protein